ncbi:MAG: HAMP domain-containing protein, partial [Candidatus Eremiobacteraeota bacterium]|nr:HAMP domain-containing protein [Candidatus Eremiobacteraeota bacterium]
MRSLRGRLTFSYAAFVMTLFIAVAIILTREAVSVYARSANDAIAGAAAQIRQLADANPKPTFTQLSEDVHKNVERPGLRIIGIQTAPGFKMDRPPFRPADGVRGVYVKLQRGPAGLVPVPPPGIKPGGLDDRSSLDRVLYSIASIAGIGPERVQTDVGIFFVSSDILRFKALISWYAFSVVIGLVVFGVLGWLIGSFLAAQALAPMVAVTGALQRFADGDFTPQNIDARARTEVGELARAFNGAAAQVAAAFDERRRVEEYIRQFVADASDELRTP